MPPSNLLSNVFGRSPIKAIQQHYSCVHSAAEELEPFFLAALSEHWQQAEECQQRINELEEAADRIKSRIRLSLPKKLFLPAPRTDLLELLTVQDRVANRAKDIAGIVYGRRMVFPAPMREGILNFVKRSIEASAQALKAISELDSLLETGFQGREVDLVETMIEELDAIESDTDNLQVHLRQALFQIEKQLPPVDVIFFYQIIEGIGDLADRSSRVGGHLQLLLAH